MGLFLGIVLQLGFFVSSSFFCFSYSVIEAYFFVYSVIFFIPSGPLVHISGVIICSLLVCSVYVQSHRTWSTVSPVPQKGHCESVIPFIRGPWVALVYPVLSLEITTCCLLVMPLVSSSYSCFSFHVVASVSPSLFSEF
jgi:hypothetical protein